MIDKLGSILTGLFSVEEKGGITSNVGYAFASQAISLIASFMMSLIVSLRFWGSRNTLIGSYSSFMPTMLQSRCLESATVCI